MNNLTCKDVWPLLFKAYIASHPDDKNTRRKGFHLSMSRWLLAKTGVLFSDDFSHRIKERRRCNYGFQAHHAQALEKLLSLPTGSLKLSGSSFKNQPENIADDRYGRAGITFAADFCNIHADQDNLLINQFIRGKYAPTVNRAKCHPSHFAD